MANPKKIAVIDHVGVKAGMDAYSGALLNGIASQGVEAYLYSNVKASDFPSIQCKKYFSGHNNMHFVFKAASYLISVLRSTFSAKASNVDLVIIHLFAADIMTLFLVLLPKLFGLKVAVIAHDVESFSNSDRRFIQSLIYEHLANFIVVHNQFSYDALVSQISLKVDQLNAKIKVIKHGGFLDIVNPSITKVMARQKLALPLSDKYLLFFGQIKKVKGLDILLEALSKCDATIKLIIAGKPWKDDFQAYQNKINELGLSRRVVLDIGFIEDDKRALYFLASDANVLPYRVIYQSGVLLMAMSYGLPVIASDLDANKEIIDSGENGLLFKSEDALSLSNQINHFFSDNATAKKLQANSILTIKNHYDWNHIAAKYIDLV